MNNEMSDPQIEEFYTIVKELEKFDTLQISRCSSTRISNRIWTYKTSC